MNIRLALFVLFLLTIGSSQAITPALPPSITINGTVGAGDPATVYVTGQTQAINVAWNAGTDHTYCEIYYTTNGANQTELGRGHDGSKPVTFAVGSTFEFWMVVYPGNGQYTIVTKLNVVAKSSGLPPPKEPTPSKTGTGGFDEKAKPKSDSVFDYRNAPFISDVVVAPDYRNVVISFASTQSTPPLVEIAKVPPSTNTAGLKLFPSDSGAFSRFAPAQKLRYILDLDAQGQQLEVGTTYHYIINVFNNDRNATTRPREQIVGQFSTLRQSVKIVWEQIRMVDDSDDLSTAECFFWFWANYGQPTRIYSEYENNDMDTGEDYNVNRTVVIPNAPDKLILHASGLDADGTTALLPSPNGGQNGVHPLSGAEDHSVFGSENSNTNAAAQEFDLANFPGDRQSVSFRLETRGGSLKFIVFGHFEITRGAAIENIGTAGSALQTAPEQFVGTFAKTPANYQPMWVYAIKNDGDMLWYRKDSGESAWQGPKKVGHGWNFKDVIPAGGNSFYALTAEGKLMWYRHDGFNDGSRDNWAAPTEVGHGWTFTKIFSGGEGIIYAIAQDGKLRWYRHNGYLTGVGTPGAWEVPKDVGTGWNGFEQVFSAGGGIIYAIAQDGKMRWYKHNGYLTGVGTPGAWEGPKEVGTGWNGFRQVLPAGAGVILVIENNGKLRWYRHNGYLTGVGTPGAWEGPKEVGTGWQGFRQVIALLPVASAPIVR